MGLDRRGPPVLIALTLASCLLVGCGGSSSSSGSTSSSTGSSQPAAGFSKRAKVAAYGEEAAEKERAQASETLERNRSARATGTYEAECETYSAPALEAIENGGIVSASGKQNCVEALKTEAGEATPGSLANTLLAPVAALRIQGNHGVALYHGRGGDYAMRMEREDGEWKVAATITEALPTN